MARAWPLSWQEVLHWDRNGSETFPMKNHLLILPEDFPGAISAGSGVWIRVNFQLSVCQVNNPVEPDARSGIQPGFIIPILGQRRGRYFDDQMQLFGSGVMIVVPSFRALRDGYV